VEVQTPTADSIETNSGEILFMPRDTYLISDFVTIGESLEMYLIFIDHDIINTFLASKISQKKQIFSESIVCKINPSIQIEKYFAALNSVYANFDNNKGLLNLKINEFLHLMYLSNQTDIVATLAASEKQKKSRSLVTLMSDNYDKNLTVADFASLSGRSLSSFNRDFKRKYGKPPKQWLIENRMIKAAQLLANGSSVTNCAIDVGYSNTSHFIKSYKSIYGKTPSEMKKINL
jgi:AraC-like DNA-binding protein